MITPRSWHHFTKDYASCSEKNRQHHIAHRKTSSPPWTLLSNCHCQEDATSTLTHHSHNLLNQKLPRSNDTCSSPTKSLIKRSLARMLALIYRFSRNYASS